MQDLPGSSSSAALSSPADQDALPHPRRAYVEDAPDVDNETRYVENVPQANSAGATFSRSRTSFDLIRDDQVLHGAEILGPFKNDDEWQLAKWLIKNVGHNAADEFLKLAVVSSLCFVTC